MHLKRLETARFQPSPRALRRDFQKPSEDALKTGRGWTWGTPKTRRYTHNPPSPSQNNAFPSQILVHTGNFSWIGKSVVWKSGSLRNSANIKIRICGAIMQKRTMSASETPQNGPIPNPDPCSYAEIFRDLRGGVWKTGTDWNWAAPFLELAVQYCKNPAWVHVRRGNYVKHEMGLFCFGYETK